MHSNKARIIYNSNSSLREALVFNRVSYRSVAHVVLQEGHLFLQFIHSSSFGINLQLVAWGDPFYYELLLDVLLSSFVEILVFLRVFCRR